LLYVLGEKTEVKTEVKTELLKTDFVFSSVLKTLSMNGQSVFEYFLGEKTEAKTELFRLVFMHACFDHSSNSQPPKQAAPP